VSHEKSDKELFFDKWTDNWVNNLCGFFKAYGEIDRAVQEHQFRVALKKASIIDNEIDEATEVKYGM
jgi:hypothetical protein